MLTYAEAPWPDHTEESCNARQLPREVPVSGLSSLCLSLQFLSPTSLRHHPLYHPTSVRVHPGGVSWQQWFGERAISPPGHAAKDDRSHAQ